MARKTRANTPEGVLAAAARYIREHGWRPDGGQDPVTGATCLWLAVIEVVRGPKPDYDNEEQNARCAAAELLLLERLSKILGTEQRAIGRIFHWNDAPDRTVEQVLALLEGREIPA